MKSKKFLFVLSLILIAFWGCKNHVVEDEHGEAAEEAHTHATLSYTLYTDQLELFVEFNAFTLGETTDLAVHFTNLKTYKPVTRGTVKLQITGAKTHFSQTIDAPSVPGIFMSGFSPKTAEDVSFTIQYNGGEINGLFNLGTITVFKSDEEAELAMQSKGETHDPEEVIFSKEKVWDTDFGTMIAKPQPFNSIVAVSGQLEALPTQVSSVFAPADGIIHFSQNLVPGQKINKGDVLFTVDAGALTSNNLNNKYNSAKAAYEKAEFDLERAKNLVGENIISEKEFQQIKLNYENAKLNFESIDKNYSNGRQVIKAAQSGILSELMVKAGNFVEEGQQIGKIIRTEKLILKANLPQNKFESARNIISANFKTAVSDKLYKTDELNGKLVSYSATPSANNAYMPVFFEINNPGELTAGLYTEIYLKVKSTEDVITVPISALVESEGHFHVYVQKDGEGYITHDVKLGNTDGQNVIILEGLESGERVVTKGAIQIKLATSSGEIPAHSHVH